jgi:hypothetical protein
MRRSSGLALLVLASLTACSETVSAPASRLSPEASALAGKAPPPPPQVNVTSTIFDTDSAGALLLTRSDHFNGIGQASYAPSSSISSVVGTNWRLFIGNQTARTVYLALKSQGVPLPDGYYSQYMEVYAQCYDASNVQVSILAMAAGSSNGNCSFGVDFGSGGVKYKLVMGPVHPATGRSVVTCVSAATTGSCTKWSIVPNATVANAGVAQLYHYSKSGSLVPDSLYHNSYRVTATQ